MHDETALLTLPEPPAPAADPQPLATAYAAHPAHGTAATYGSPLADGAAAASASGSSAPGAAAYDVTAAHQLPVVPVAAAAPAPAPAADRSGSRLGLAFLAIVIVVLLVSGGLLLALRPGSRPTLTDTRLASEAGAVLPESGGELGGAVPPPSLDDLTAPASGDEVVPSTVAGPAGPSVSVPPTVVIVTPPPTAPPTTSAPKPTLPPTTSTTQAPKPTLSIANVSIPSKVDCSKPSEQTPYIPVSWNAPGAASVTIGIDNPGAYKTYTGTSGSDTIPFSCPGPHTYYVIAKASNGDQVTKTFTVTKQ